MRSDKLRDRKCAALVTFHLGSLTKATLEPVLVQPGSHVHADAAALAALISCCCCCASQADKQPTYVYLRDARAHTTHTHTHSPSAFGAPGAGSGRSLIKTPSESTHTRTHANMHILWRRKPRLQSLAVPMVSHTLKTLYNKDKRSKSATDALAQNAHQCPQSSRAGLSGHQGPA